MATVNTYLNFKDQTEEAFRFYQSVFGGEYISVNRFGELPPSDDMPPVPDEAKNLIMHISLPITGGHILMGSDAPEAMGFKVNKGNNVYISLHPDSREEADRLFNALSAGGIVEMAMQDTFWGAYYGSFHDQFGIGWMINVELEQ